MVQLRLKVGPKGQVLIPKFLRESYGVREGDTVIVEAGPDGIVLRGRPSVEATMEALRRHRLGLRELGIRGPELGELKGIYLEAEFERAKP